MSRDRRIDYHHAWHHVMNRGTGSKKIFYSAQDRKKFLSILAKTVEQYEIEIHAYCLMGNHYHLLIKTPTARLSPAIQYLNSLYARHYNFIRKTDGPLFRGRFKSTVIEDNNYLLTVSRYIHLNPVKASITDRSENYFWSSMPAYLGLREKPAWLQIDKVLSYFSGDTKLSEYQKFVNNSETSGADICYDDDQWVTSLGSKDFLASVKSFQELTRRQGVERIASHLPSIEHIQKTVADHYNVPLRTIEKHTLMEENLPRAMAIYLSRYLGKQPHSKIARSFHNKSPASSSMAISRFKKKMKADFAITEEMMQLAKLLRLE